MRGTSPLQSFSDRTRFAPSPTRERGGTPINKLVKVTTTHPQILMQQVVRPVERRTVQLYDKECPEHQVQIDHLQQEKQRLISTLHDQHNQIEGWKIKYSNLEREILNKPDRTNEVETFKQLLNESREKFSQEVQSLRFELQHQKQIHHQNESELHRRIDDQIGVIEDQEAKITLFSTEIQHMNCVLQQRQAIIDQLRLEDRDFKNLETQVKVRDDIIEERNLEIGQLRRQQLRLPDIENTLQISRQENERLQNLNQTIEVELSQRLNIIKSQEGEIQSLKTQLLQLDSQYCNTKDQLRSKNNLFERLEADTLAARRDFENTIADLTNQIGNYQQSESELSGRLSKLQNQLDQEKAYYQQSFEENYQKLCLLSIEIENLNNKLKLKQAEYDQLNEKYNQTISEKNAVIGDQESLIQDLDLKFNKSEERLSLICLETEGLLKEQQELRTQINRQQEVINSKDIMLQESEVHLERLQKQYIDLQRSNNDLKCKYEELDRITTLIKDNRDQLADALNQESQRSKQLTRDYESQLDDTRNNLVTMRDQYEGQISCLSNEIDSLQNKVSQLENTVIMLASENERVNIQLKEQSIRVQEGEQAFLTLSQTNDLQSQENRLLNDKIYHLAENHNLLEEQNQQLINDLRKNQSLTEGFEQEIVEYRETVTYLTNELDSWKKKFISINREFHKTQEDYMMVQAEFDAFKQRRFSTTKEAEVVTKSILVDKENRRSTMPLQELN